MTEYNTDSNAMPGFDTAIPVKRKAVLKLTQSSFDPLVNFAGLPILLFESLFVRIAFAPYGVAAAALNAAVLARHAYLFPVVLITGIPNRYDASAGAPHDLEARTVAPYCVMGETPVSFTF